MAAVAEPRDAVPPPCLPPLLLCWTWTGQGMHGGTGAAEPRLSTRPLVREGFHKP